MWPVPKRYHAGVPVRTRGGFEPATLLEPPNAYPVTPHLAGVKVPDVRR
jgi:hypothetical protein